MAAPQQLVPEFLLTAQPTSEEQLRPWRTSFRAPLDRPLLRLWDYWSGSQPDDKKNMYSRAPEARLDTYKSRQQSLAIHINHGNWTDTPYISVTTSPDAIDNLAETRASNPKRSGPAHLTVIDPYVRSQNGMPVLDFAAEMRHYNVPNPYGNGRYEEGHFLCLWRIMAEEIVYSWPWDELVKDPNWYLNTVMLAFCEFRSKALQREAERGKLNDKKLNDKKLNDKKLNDKKSPSRKK